jgi:CHAT domain-containing protein/tetratricopeptide (TPR) repeat protein
MFGKMRTTLLVAFYSLPFLSAAQDWKSQYELAIKQYQQGEYATARATAKDAYESSTTLDLKNQAYTLQLITVICLDEGNADEGLQWIERETALFLQTEGVKSKTYAEGLGKHARFLVQKGQLGAAEGKCKDALVTYASAGLAEAVEYNDLNFLYGQILSLNNKASEALPVVELCVTKYNGNPDRGEEYIDALLLSASLSEKLKDPTSAEKKYRQLVALLEKNSLQQLPAYTQSQTAISRIATAGGKTSEATEILKTGAVGAEDRAKQLLKIAVDYQNAHQLNKSGETFVLGEQAVIEGGLQNNTAFSIYLNHGRLLTEQGKLDEASVRFDNADKLSKILFKAPSGELALLDFARGDRSIAGNQIADAGRHYIAAHINSQALPLATRIKYLTLAARSMLIRDQPLTSIALLKGDMVLLPDKSVNDALLIDAVVTYTSALTEIHQHDAAVRTLSDMTQKASADPSTKILLQLQHATVLRESGQWPAAVTLLNESAKDPSLDPSLRIRVDFQLGDIYIQLGDFGQAEKHLLACIEAIKKHAPSDNLQLDAYNSLAILYTRLGNYTRAEEMYMDLLKKPDPSPGFHTSIQQNLATLYFESARYTEAELLLEDVLRQDRERYGEEHPDYATSMQNLAAVYLKNKEFVKARDLYEKSLALDARLGGTQSLSYATKAANLGIVHHESGNFEKAHQYLSAALLIREKKLGKDHPDYVFNEYNLANVFQETNQSQKALPLFRHVGAFYVQQIHELFPAMSEREKTAFYNKISEVITAYLDFMISQAASDKSLTGEIYDFRLSTKALLLNSSAKIRDRILSSRDSQLLESFGAWLKIKEELGKLYSLGFEERQINKDLIASLQRKSNELERLLSQKSTLFAESSSEGAVDWKKVRQSLTPGTAAVEMIRLGLDKKQDSVLYAALILRPEVSEPQLIVFPNSRRMETREFSFYRNAIHYQLINERSYEAYWKPIANSLQGVTKLYVSADGVFNKVNIATLYDPSTKQYLVEQYSIGLVSNTRELAGSPAISPTSLSASLFGNPDFGSPTTSANSNTRGMNNLARGIIGTGIAALPGTMSEINGLDAFLKERKWQTSLYLSAQATEQAIKAQNNPRILHIATHGFFVETTDETKAVVGGGDLSQSENNPLLRSGLVLAGAGKLLVERGPSGEDGVLTAYEAMNLSLDNTDLVVLSACETGAGEIRNGEGVYGLQRAFLLAGASNMLMSLWKVDDQATLELMLQFYRDLDTTKDKSQAFRNTQLEMKKIHPHPYFWGSFVLIGHN